MIRQLRIKFICINMTIVTALLCVIFGLIIYFTDANLESESMQAMQSIAANHSPPGKPGERPNPYPQSCFSLQLGFKGEVLELQSGSYDLSDIQYLADVVNAALSQPDKTGILKEYGLRYLISTTPMGYQLVFSDISSEQATIAGLTRTCIFIGILSLLVFFVVSLLLARWAVKPVAQAWEQQRQFVADASHELKTPLTVSMTNAELLQDPQHDSDARRQFSDSILTMSRQMRGLVEGLLDLARADNGSATMHFTELDFSQLTGEAVLPFEPVCFEQGLLLSCDIAPGIRLSGSEGHLRQVLDILLDNAIKYTSSGGNVTVSLAKQGKHCLLRVANPGEAISQEDLKNIFKRFYRIDKARAMNRSYGLGLSIAQSIVKEHRGRIWAQSEGGLNTFFVQLPCE